MTPELVIGVVVCNLVCPDVNAKVNVKASYGQPDTWLVRSVSPSPPGSQEGSG